jgi:hypothetical protein
MMRTKSILLSIVIVPILALVLAPVSALKADFTATGTFQYQDRELDRQGFTGDEPFLPIRYADVEVLDDNSSVVLGTGFTDEAGQFQVLVSTNIARDIVIRVLTSTDHVPFSNRRTEEWSGFWNGNPYALESPIYTNHDPNTDIDMGTVGATSDGPGKPFNIFDVQLDETAWIMEMIGGNPNNYREFQARWRDGANIGQAFYDGIGISIGGELPYDDTVIGHEGGHFMNDTWSRDDNPGGSHFLGDNNQDPRLSYGEGVATWYASVSRDLLGTNPAPHLYINTTGGEGPGNLSFSYEIEAPSGGWFGPANEVIVTSALWDIVDGTDTIDDTPGVDDDLLDIADAEVWEVFVDYLPLGVAAPRTVEDFWDGWLDPAINNGFLDEMISNFLAFRIEYFEDDLEPDNDTAESNPLNFQDDPVHHTLYPDADEDWHRLDIIDNASFSIRTSDRLPATVPVITVFESDGVTEIGNNDGDISLPVNFDGVGSGPYYARVQQKVGGFGFYTEYGHFDLVYNITSAPPESAQIQLSPTAIIKTAQIGQTVVDTAMIMNVGGGPLQYTLSDMDRFGEEPIDLPWLIEDPASGTVAPGDTAFIVVTFDTDGLTPDSAYDALILVNSNDIVTPTEDIIVRLTTQGAVGIGDDEVTPDASLPRAFALSQNYPNPFNPSTSIAFDVPVGHEEGVQVELDVFNVRGQKVATLIDEKKTPGSYVVHWDGRDDEDRRVGSGIFIYRIKAGTFHSTRKMVILK